MIVQLTAKGWSSAAARIGSTDIAGRAATGSITAGPNAGFLAAN